MNDLLDEVLGAAFRTIDQAIIDHLSNICIIESSFTISTTFTADWQKKILPHLKTYLINIWNSLPEELVMDQGKRGFKRIEKFMEDSSINGYLRYTSDCCMLGVSNWESYVFFRHL